MLFRSMSDGISHGLADPVLRDHNHHSSQTFLFIIDVVIITIFLVVMVEVLWLKKPLAQASADADADYASTTELVAFQQYGSFLYFIHVGICLGIVYVYSVFNVTTSRIFLIVYVYCV